MESQICYCAVDGNIAVVRNRDNTAGAPPPELVMGLPCELRLRLFANCEDATPYPASRFSGIAGWGFVMDTDFSPLSTVKLVADNADIRVDEVVDGGATYTQIAIPITSTHTAELASALDGKECITLAGELIGYDSGHAEVFVLQIKGFTVRGRVAGPGEPIPIPTAAYEAMAQEFVSSAVISGGLISSGAVTSKITASALPKNQPFSTTVGGYTVELTGADDNGFRVTYNDANLGASGQISIGYGGLTLRYSELGSGQIEISATGTITANGSAITQTTSEFAGTSLGIDELAGGVKYICQSALTALSIGSAGSGCNGTIIFTAANGAIVTPPANVPYFGVTSYTAGSSYLMMINDFAAVCNEAAIVPEV